MGSYAKYLGQITDILFNHKNKTGSFSFPPLPSSPLPSALFSILHSFPLLFFSSLYKSILKFPKLFSWLPMIVPLWKEVFTEKLRAKEQIHGRASQIHKLDMVHSAGNENGCAL